MDTATMLPPPPPPAPAKPKSKFKRLAVASAGVLLALAFAGAIVGGDAKETVAAKETSTTTPTTAPTATSAPSTTEYVAPALSETDINLEWWTDTGEYETTKVQQDLAAFGEMDTSDITAAIEPCSNLYIDATILSQSVPDTEMGHHLKAAADAYVKGADLCTAMDYEGALPYFQRAGGEIDLATAAL